MTLTWFRYYHYIILERGDVKILWHGKPIGDGDMVGYFYYHEMPDWRAVLFRIPRIPYAIPV